MMKNKGKLFTSKISPWYDVTLISSLLFQLQTHFRVIQYMRILNVTTLYYIIHVRLFFSFPSEWIDDIRKLLFKVFREIRIRHISRVLCLDLRREVFVLNEPWLTTSTYTHVFEYFHISAESTISSHNTIIHVYRANTRFHTKTRFVQIMMSDRRVSVE
jgi:hypothetical protein